MIRIERILYPTDFSEYADYARPYVVDLARTFNAEVLLLHVVDIATPPGALDFLVASERIQELLEGWAEKEMKEYLKKFSDEHIAVLPILKRGTSYSEIVNLAREKRVDFIILATHGRGAIKQFFIGSTAERVVRLAPCPVLTIHHPEHEFVRSEKPEEAK